MALLRRWLLIALAGIFLLAVPGSVAASCVALSDQEKYDRADAVAIGTVVASDASAISGSTAKGPWTRIDLSLGYKGDAPGTIFLVNPFAPAVTSVDVAFAQGKNYLLFLRKTDQASVYTTNACDGTREFDGALTAGEERVFLGSPAADGPAPTVTGEEQPQGTRRHDGRTSARVPWIVLLGLAVVAVAALVWQKRPLEGKSRRKP